ncbi:nanos, isoform A [Drosophila ananassae]|uniref:Nanos, isoform A n=2 Tax=Drosophila ananassae TaxID=7217 RepID=B3M1N5_DROAN|nr:protein nanos isoform X2 [Drosophila ananassae]EDV44365.1 nanos, isoform A [Drosophila ananassae]
MFRSSLEGNAAADNYSAFHGRGGLNLLGLQDMYLDTSGTTGSLPPTPSVSSATLSPPSTPLTPLTPEPTAQTTTHFPLLADSAAAANTLLLQRQYHYHLLLHQQQQQLALAQHQLALAASAAAVNVNNHQKDEIARSLKIFAQLTTGASENAHGSMQDVMQEFAANGYVSDDINRFHYGSAPPQAMTPPPPPPPSLQAPLGHTSSPQASPNVNLMPVSVPAPLTAHWLSNYREQLNNVWRHMSYMPTATNTASLQAQAAMPIAPLTGMGVSLGFPIQPDHLRNGSISNNANKVHKRFNNKTKDVNRHCVFCENNSEPEAVVNSHTVRDNFNRVLCPKLRTYVCPICGASGDSAHTIKYCPKKPIITMEDAIKAESFRLAKSSYYKQQMKV